MGDGIEMVQALDETHAVDIVLAQHPDAQVKAVPAASIEGMNKHRFCFLGWSRCKAQWPKASNGWARELTLAGPGCSEHDHPGG